MAIEKLFQALVVGGVTLGVQACASKQAKNPDVPTQQEKEPQLAAPEVVERPIEPAPRSLFTGTNSKGEKCEDICFGESSGEAICSDMCCWLMAVECCPDYVAPPKDDSKSEEGE